jgi:hypothetical protein
VSILNLVVFNTILPKGMAPVGDGKWNAPVRPWQMTETPHEIVRCMMGAGDALIELTPDWFSPSAGSAQYNHTVRAFLIDRPPVLSRLERDAWPLASLATGAVPLN